MQKMKISLVTFWTILFPLALALMGQSTIKNKIPKVKKNNPLPIFVHYMPWFDAPKNVTEKWGLHWTMANQNPEKILRNGQRQIASHFYPLIGPYDSGDDALLEYHLLLMKFSGIDGLLIDWPSSHDILDYQTNRLNAEALIKKISCVGLRFAIVYEDYTTREVARVDSISSHDAARADLQYISDNYFNSQNYLEIEGAPLLLVFGPRQIVSDFIWKELLNVLQPIPHFIPLWHRSKDLPSSFGEFAWIDSGHLKSISKYYHISAPTLNWVMGVAYPGFRDYYEEGGWESHHLNWEIDHKGTETFSQTLKMAQEADVDAVQLATWNDFGEGTMIEPTHRFGYTLLEELQHFSGISYDGQVFKLIHSLYTHRKLYAKNDSIQARLDSAFHYFANLNVVKATEFLNP